MTAAPGYRGPLDAVARGEVAAAATLPAADRDLDNERPGAATPANHSMEIYWFARSAAAVAMYFEWR